MQLTREIENNDFEAIKRILNSDPTNIRLFTDVDHYYFQRCCELGNTEIIKMVLSYDEIDPTDGSNFGIRIANEMGHKEIVDLIFHHPKMDHTKLLHDIEWEKVYYIPGDDKTDLLARTKAYIRDKKLDEILE